MIKTSIFSNTNALLLSLCSAKEASGKSGNAVLDDTDIALKFIDHTAINENLEWHYDRLQSEVLITLNLRHKHMIRAFDYHSIDDHHFLFMDLMSGSLNDLLFPDIPSEYHSEEEKDHWYKSNTFWGTLGPTTFTRLWSKQIINVIHHLHCSGVSHMDLKPVNILYTGDHPNNWCFVLADFGLAIRHNHQMALSTGGTEGFQSPESKYCNKPIDTTASDIYSLGATIIESIAGNVNEFEDVFDVIRAYFF